MRCDVTKAAEVKASFDRIKKELGKIDILVNNAAEGQDFLRYRLRVGVLDVGNGDVGALFGHAQDYPTSDAGAAARDHRHLASEPHRFVSPVVTA